MFQKMNDSGIDSNAKIYDDVKIYNSTLRSNSVLADRCDINNVIMNEFSEFGRSSLVRDTIIGKGSYTGSNAIILKAVIGKYCSMSWNISIGGGNHSFESASMYSIYWWNRVFDRNIQRHKALNITYIGNDVWIGASATILSGVTICDGAIIGAGAVVTKDVPPYTIVVGNPAKKLKMRFDDDIIKELMDIRWWDWEHDKIARNAHLLSVPVDKNIIKKLREAE